MAHLEIGIRHERYVETAVRSELDELANTSSGRNAALNKAAFALGQFVGAGKLGEQEAVDRLFAACEANGYARQDGTSAVRATIKSGLGKGMREPRELPQLVPSHSAARKERPEPRPRKRQNLREFAEERRIPIDALRHMGFEDSPRGIEIRYQHRGGRPARTQFRDPAWCDHRFAWDPEGRDLDIVAFDPDQGELARKSGRLLVVEGASDAATAHYAGVAAIGIPGADMVRKTLRAHHFEGVSQVFVCVDTNESGDPDGGGDKFRGEVPRCLKELGFAGAVHELRMPGHAKDLSELWVRDPETFTTTLSDAMRAASEPPRPDYLTLSQMAAECLRPIGQRLKTGFQTLDAATRGGLPLGRLVAVLGAPGAGKSTFCAQLADALERQGCAVVYLASDEPAEGIVTRLGQLDGFSRETLESDGDAGDAVRSGFARSAEGRTLSVIDPDAREGMRTIEDSEKALAHLGSNGQRVLIVDSLQTVQCKAADGAESTREKIDAKMGVLKAIAKRGVLVVVISEMARSAYRSGDRNVDTSALAAGKESGGIEYGVALLIGLRSVKGEHGLVDVEVAKNRLGGEKPEFRLALDFDRASFSEVAMPEGGKDQFSEETRAQRARDRVVAVIRLNPSLRAADAVTRAAGGNRQDNLAMIREMLETGEVTKVSGCFRLAPEAEGGRS